MSLKKALIWLLLFTFVLPTWAFAQENILSCQPGDVFEAVFALAADSAVPDAVMGELEFDHDVFEPVPSDHLVITNNHAGLYMYYGIPEPVSFRVRKHAPDGLYTLSVKVLQAAATDGKKIDQVKIMPVQVRIGSAATQPPTPTPTRTPTPTPTPSIVPSQKSEPTPTSAPISTEIQEETLYQAAFTLEQEGKYSEALKKYKSLGSYKDAAQKCIELQWKINYQTKKVPLFDCTAQKLESIAESLALKAKGWHKPADVPYTLQSFPLYPKVKIYPKNPEYLKLANEKVKTWIYGNNSSRITSWTYGMDEGCFLDPDDSLNSDYTMSKPYRTIYIQYREGINNSNWWANYINYDVEREIKGRINFHWEFVHNGENTVEFFICDHYEKVQIYITFNTQSGAVINVNNY